jgi:dihydroorotate dehydrogenase (NAD+) catalytic subunit
VSDLSLTTRVGSVTLTSPILTAAGTAGYGDELSAYGDLATLGAIVTKSLASFAWDGNPAPRVAPSGTAMLNSVGLAGPGVSAWRATTLDALRARGATVVASIWGRTVDEFHQAASDLAGADVSAVEVNASCPNLEGRKGIFAHSAAMTQQLVDATRCAGVPLWVKLSPNTPDLVEIATAAVEAGADALVLTNTLLGMDVDIDSAHLTLGNGGGGVSGVAIFPVALRAVFEVRAALGEVPIVGVGGIASGRDAVAMLMAGANAVEVGTASLASPRAPWRIQRELRRWCRKRGVTSVDQLWGRAHGH